MTNAEFSDAFSTMLNSYNTQMQFGEQASKAEIVLDEYEKSVFLTQAQDIIVKSYFDARLNAEGMGLDDGTKRQLDFSSLIRVASLSPLATQENTYDSRGIMYQMPIGADESSPQALFILNEKLVDVHYNYENTGSLDLPCSMNNPDGTISGSSSIINRSKYKLNIQLSTRWQPVPQTTYTTAIDTEDSTLNVYITYGMSTDGAHNSPLIAVFEIVDGLFSISANLTIAYDSNYITQFDNCELGEVESALMPTSTFKKEYVIVPISYKEYDRMMSRPYSQPLKKQAWRLFQNQVTGFDVQTELIPKFNVVEKDTATEKSEFLYKIRYVQRPTPIVLEDLPDGLSIDGVSEETPCMLNPVLHQDILNKAVDLAITTRGGTPAATQARQARRQEKD